MLDNKILNNETLSNQMKFNRRKALEIILFGGTTTNKSVLKIVQCAEQQTLLLKQLENKILNVSMNFEEIFCFLNEYGKWQVLVAVAALIKNHIDYAIIEKDGEEQLITVNLLEQIEEEPQSYNLTFAKANETFLNYQEHIQPKKL